MGVWFSSVQFSRSVMSDSLRPHESQHTTPGGMVLIHKSQIFGRLYFSDFVTHIWENVVVHLDSHVRLFATPWTAACQPSLSFTISQSLLKLMSIELMMPFSHLILCHPLLLLLSIFPSIRVFSSESALRIRWPRDWSFSFKISQGYLFAVFLPPHNTAEQMSLNKWPPLPPYVRVEIRHWRDLQTEEVKIKKREPL